MFEIEYFLTIEQLDRLYNGLPEENAEIVVSVLENVFINKDILYILNPKLKKYKTEKEKEVNETLVLMTSFLIEKSYDNLTDTSKCILKSTHRNDAKIMQLNTIKKYLKHIKRKLTREYGYIVLVDNIGEIHFENGYIDICTNIFKKRDINKEIISNSLIKYIPISRIQENIEEINNLPLPYDVIQYIKSFSDGFIPIPKEKVGEKVDRFWVNLGIETDNLYYWNYYCWNILSVTFGDSKKLLYKIAEKFDKIRSLFDDFVCASYPLTIHSIEVDEENIKITNIFYKKDIHLIKYPKTNYEKRRTISLQDKEYILEYLDRLNIYVNYVKNKITEFPVNVDNFKIKSNYPMKNKMIKKIITEITKMCVRLYEKINNKYK
jgi:hypothetical protein